MKINEILEAIKELAKSQGFYGRMYANLMELKENDGEAWAELVEKLEAKKFKNTLDFIFWVEC